MLSSFKSHLLPRSHEQLRRSLINSRKEEDSEEDAGSGVEDLDSPEDGLDSEDEIYLDALGKRMTEIEAKVDALLSSQQVTQQLVVLGTAVLLLAFALPHVIGLPLALIAVALNRRMIATVLAQARTSRATGTQGSDGNPTLPSPAQSPTNTNSQQIQRDTTESPASLTSSDCDLEDARLARMKDALKEQFPNFNALMDDNYIRTVMNAPDKHVCEGEERGGEEEHMSVCVKERQKRQQDF